MRLLIAFCMLMAAAACARRAPDTAPVQAGPPPAPMAYALFNVVSAAAAPIRLGQPLVLDTRVTARAPVERATLVIVMPEAAAARVTGWGESYRMFGINVRVPATDSVEATITPSTPLQRRTSVDIEAPGYYHVIATARSSGGRYEENGVPLVDPQHYSYYVWIDDEGGYITRDFDATRLPLFADPSPGPIRTPQRGSQMMAQLDSAHAAPRTHAVVHGIVRSAAGAPAAGVRVQVRSYMESCPGRGAAEEVARTDAAGRYRTVLRGWPRNAVAACVAVHADRAGAHATAHRNVQMKLAAAQPDSVRIDLQLVNTDVR